MASVEPGFVYITDPNNPWYLAWDSPCIDAGNPLFGSEEVGIYDLDGEDRIWDRSSAQLPAAGGREPHGKKKLSNARVAGQLQRMVIPSQNT